MLLELNKEMNFNNFYKNDNLTTKGIINTMDWKDKLLSLPMHPFLTDDEINYVCTSIKEFYNNKKGDTT